MSSQQLVVPELLPRGCLHKEPAAESAWGLFWGVVFWLPRPWGAHLLAMSIHRSSQLFPCPCVKITCPMGKRKEAEHWWWSTGSSKGTGGFTPLL